jgi:hypothetical protein
MNDTNDHWRWGKTVVACLEIVRENNSLPVGLVDFEVIPPFDGSADGIFVWLIVNSSTEVAAFRESCIEAATDYLRRELVLTEFPESAVSTLQFDVTSLEDIFAGGGRFSYFR